MDLLKGGEQLWVFMRGGEVKSEREGVTRTFTQGTVMSRDLEVCREIERMLSGSIYVTIS